MIKRHNRKLISILLSTTILNTLFLSFPASSMEQSFFEVISTRFNKNASFVDNLNRLKNVTETISNKIKNQEKLYLNTNYKKSKQDIENAKKLLEKAEVAYTIDDSEQANSIINNAIKNLKSAQLNLMPSRSAEMRGMFLDADFIPKTKEGITNLIIKIKNSGFNAIYPEVFRRGYTLVRSSLTETDPSFKDLNFDVFEYIVQEAHKYKIEVHPWFWCFRVKSPEKGNPVLSKYPELASIKENDTTFEPLFLSPSSPESREFVKNIIMFFVLNYEIDGVLLDYIRYDDQSEEDFLSKKYFKQHYFAKNGIEPPSDIPKNEPIFTEWQLWRENNINIAVKSIRQTINSIKPNLSIGAAVFRTEGEGRLTKMQDWRLWDSNNWIDYASSMLYTNNKEDLKEWLNAETDLETRKDFLYPILGFHKFALPEDLYSQYGVLYNREVTGFTIFTLQYFNEELYNDLPIGIFRKNAIVPDKNPIKASKMLLNDISIWLKEIQKSEIDIPEEDLKNYIYKIDILKNSLPEHSKNYKDHFNLKNKLDELKKISIENKQDNIFPNNLSKEINEQLDYVIKIVDIHIRRELSKNKEIIPKLPPFKPLKETSELPNASVTKIGIPPIIDGKIEGDFWNKIEPLSRFYWHLGFSKSETETVVKVAYGNENMYVLFENLEPKMANTLRQTDNDDDWKIFNDDNVEFLLNISGFNQDFRFTVNMNNAKIAQKNNKAITEKSGFESAVNIEKDKWFVEMKIPFKTINFLPQNGSSLRVNFSRTRPQELNPYSHWSPTYNTVDNIFRFGMLNFK
ncbi:MAG: family 10 glycosylhydrolase [Cyanobacteriota bacterium]